MLRPGSTSIPVQLHLWIGHLHTLSSQRSLRQEGMRVAIGNIRRFILRTLPFNDIVFIREKETVYRVLAKLKRRFCRHDLAQDQPVGDIG